MEQILCKRCGQRRARRACPALQADICAICCGTEREVSISCPFECEHLREAHQRETASPAGQTDVAEPQVEVSEKFLREHEELVLFSIHSLLRAAVRTPGAVDSDALEALDALIKTQRTAESGLIYESRAKSGTAAAVQRLLAESFAEYEKAQGERGGLTQPRRLSGGEILTMLVFLRRLGQHNLNGRPKGRLFLDLLRQMTAEMRIDEPAPGIIL